MNIKRKFSKIQPKNKEELIAAIAKKVETEGQYCDLNDIDTSLVTDMSYLFHNNILNCDISQWDVSNVTNMASMFESAEVNCDISQWNVSNVTNMNNMFAYADFNQDISNWDVSKVIKKSLVFYDCPIEESYKPHFNDKTFACGGKKKFAVDILADIKADLLKNAKSRADYEDADEEYKIFKDAVKSSKATTEYDLLKELRDVSDKMVDENYNLYHFEDLKFIPEDLLDAAWEAFGIEYLFDTDRVEDEDDAVRKVTKSAPTPEFKRWCKRNNIDL